MIYPVPGILALCFGFLRRTIAPENSMRQKGFMRQAKHSRHMGLLKYVMSEVLKHFESTAWGLSFEETDNGAAAEFGAAPLVYKESPGWDLHFLKAWAYHTKPLAVMRFHARSSHRWPAPSTVRGCCTRRLPRRPPRTGASRVTAPKHRKSRPSGSDFL